MIESAFEEAYAALVSGAAACRLPAREYVVAGGEDRRRFVNGLVTCDVRTLDPGQAAYGFFTSPKGRILADAVISAGDDCLVLELPAGRAGEIAEHMLRYKVADRVEIEPAGATDEVVVAGPGATVLVGGLLEVGAPAEVPYRSLDEGASLHREVRLGIPAVRLVAPREVVGAFETSLAAAGAVAAGAAAVAAVRVERGVPWYGVDFGEESFPQETGLEEEAVSYTKGCYLGQEIVARIHYRGQVNRRIRGLRAGDAALEAGAELFCEGESVGRVTTVARSPALGEVIALAIVHRKAARSVDLDDGSRLELVDLPFVD